MVRKWTIRTLVMALSVATIIGGYAALFHLSPGAARAEVVGDDPRILVWQQRYGGMNALASGTLRFDSETKCLVLEDEHDGTLWAIVWPRGTRPLIDDGKRGVRVGGFLGRFGGRSVLEGDRIRLGGGGVEELPGDALAESGCSYQAIWQVHETVEVVSPATSSSNP